MIPSTGPLSATVPAVLDACVTALDQFGTKTLAEVMQPAIQLADGFPIDELRVQYIKTRAPIFSQWPDAKRSSTRWRSPEGRRHFRAGRSGAHAS